jgi:hypothetical protein
MQQEMANDKAAADAKIMEAQARAAEAKAKGTEVQAKIDSGHYAPKTEAAGVAPPPDQDLPSDTMQAQAKIIDAHSKAREVGVREREVAVHEMEARTENENRDLDREDKMKEAAIGLAGDVIRRPPAGESGQQVSTDKVGRKTSKIIKDVDKGLK